MRRILFPILLALLGLATVGAVAYLAQGRDGGTLHRVRLLVSAPGGEIHVGGVPRGHDQARILLTGGESSSFRMPERGDPSDVLKAEIAGGGEILTQPDWEVYNNRHEYVFPHLFEDPVRYRTPEGTVRTAYLVTYRHAVGEELLGVTLTVLYPDDAEPLWQSTEISKEVVEDWWHERVLKTRVMLRTLDIALRPGSRANDSAVRIK